MGIGEETFDQTFLVCENLKRGVILGKDFARQNCAGVYWTPNNTRVLHINFQVIAETQELFYPKPKLLYMSNKPQNYHQEAVQW